MLSNKKEWLMKHMQESQKYYIEQKKKPDTKIRI